MIRKFQLALAASILAIVGGTFTTPALAKAKQATVAELVKKVDIPYTEFTLDNGLSVIVHEDRKAPIVAVSVWYDVGSKHEPKGKTGYAHLFEHIMFNGSENAPGEYFEYTRKLGATDLNGTTWLDRTNYFQTVPTPALEGALFLESDRMGYLLGAITQENLKNQIGVVSNEKRQSDNQPYGLVDYVASETLFPKGHPYHHSTIGSLEDLAAGTLDDMKQWFTDHYGPNNAVLVLAGDINAAQAKPLVEKWFGGIAKGKESPAVNAPIPTLDAPKKIILKDKVSTTRIYRNWVVAGRTQQDYVPLFAAASILGGLSSSRLDNILVREEEKAVRVSSYVYPFVHGSMFFVEVDVKPGGDADAVAVRLDAIMADYMATGPTADEVQRFANSTVASVLGGLEQVGGFTGKASTLAEGKLYAGDTNQYKRELEQLATLTPATVQQAMKSWLSRPVFEIRVEPGEREAYKEVGSGTGGSVQAGAEFNGALLTPAFYTAPGESAPVSGNMSGNVAADRSKMPEVGPIPNVDFPDVVATTLKNGMRVFYAQRPSLPVTRIVVSFDAGYASDSPDKRGLASFTGNMLDEGTTSLNAVQLAEARERVGAQINVSSSLDRTKFSMQALSTNLGASLDLLADVIKNPAFGEKEIGRVRVEQTTRIQTEKTEPQSIALRNLPPLIYGASHPYGGPWTGSGDEASVANITRDDLVNFHRGYIHPEKAEIFIVGDVPLKKMKKQLEKRFGNWSLPTPPAPAKNFSQTLPEQKARIVLVDRPNSPQSLIFAGHVMNKKGSDDLISLRAANDILGGDFTARINMDLRETKGWSYGSSSFIRPAQENMPFMIASPVQTDKTGPSVAAIIGHVKDFTGSKGVTPQELSNTIRGNTLELPGSYEQSDAVIGQMEADRLYERPSNYVETLAGRYAKLSAEELNGAMRDAVTTDKLTWLVVGDVAKIKPQLESLGLPIEMAGETATESDKAGHKKAESK